MLDAARPSNGSIAPLPLGYLSHCPQLSADLAQLAEDSDYRPLLKSEREALSQAVWDCAVAIRMARPALVHAQIEGRLAAAEAAAETRARL